MRLIYITLLIFTCGICTANEFEGLRLTWTTNPQSEALISWESSKKTNDDYVMAWEEGEKPTRFDAGEVKTYSKSKSKSKSKIKMAYYRHVKLHNLKPSTKYKLTAHSNAQKSRELYFITAPDDDRPFKLIYAGDSRNGGNVTKQISRNIADHVERNPEIIAVIHGGDYASSPIWGPWKQWLNFWTQTTGKDGRLIPLIPVVGNHEKPTKYKMFSEAYGQPGGNDLLLYSCDLAPNFRIAVLNSQIPAEGPQKDFLVKTLEKYKEDKVTWQIAAFHSPAFPAVKKASKIQRLVPLFDKYDIDLALEADGHCIKRTVPIKNGKLDPTGVVYLGEGGYGVKQRNPKKPWYLKEPGFASQGHHYMLFHVTPKSIDYQTIGADGSVIDKYSFKPKQR